MTADGRLLPFIATEKMSVNSLWRLSEADSDNRLKRNIIDLKRPWHLPHSGRLTAYRDLRKTLLCKAFFLIPT